jgi:PAS domain S-box-containing protein
MPRRAPVSRILDFGPVKYSIVLAVLGVIGLLAIVQWTAYSVRTNIRVASLSVFPAALDAQRASTAFERMKREYRDAFVMQEKADLVSADQEAATVGSSLDAAATSIKANSRRHQQIVSLMRRIASLRERSKIIYATAAEPNALPPRQEDMAELAHENKAVETALATLQNDLANDLRTELSVITRLLFIQGIIQFVMLAGVIVALFYSIRSAINTLVKTRGDEVVRQAHLELESERRMLRALIDNIPDFMYVKDIKSRFVIANAHLARVVGVETPDELTGKTDYDYFPREMADSFFSDEQHIICSGQSLYNSEEKGLDSAGNETLVLTTKVLLRDSSHQVIGIAGVGRDISLQKKLEKELREAEQRYRGIFDKAVIGIFQSTPEGNFLSVNPAMAFTFGYDSPAEMTNYITDMTQHFFANPKRGLDFMLVMDRIGGVKNFECEAIRKDGSQVWIAMSIRAIRQNGTVIRYEGMCEDITERKEMERALRETEEKYRGIFDNSIVGIFQNTQDGRFLSVNSSLAYTLLYDSPEDMIANITDIASQLYVDPNRRDEFKSLMDKVGAVQNFECEVYCKNGSKIWLAINAVNIRENDVSIRYEGMCEDITERIQLREQLLQAQKLESVGQLAAGIAHEINTPTQYIGDNTRFLKEAFEDLKSLLGNYERLLSANKCGTMPDEALQEIQAAIKRTDADYLLEEIPKAIDQSLEGVGRVAALVSAMKEFSHPDTKEKTLLDLNRAIGSTITVARNEWKYVSDMETEFDPSLPMVSCLPGEFNQVILNLIVNASHAIADVIKNGGPAKGMIKVRTLNCSEWAEVRIQDSGSGIPKDVQSRIFDPFFTTKEIGKGTGQGLAIARSVVVGKHGGTIHFETEEGKGTTFIIRLPYDGKELSSKAVAA